MRKSLKAIPSRTAKLLRKACRGVGALTGSKTHGRRASKRKRFLVAACATVAGLRGLKADTVDLQVGGQTGSQIFFDNTLTRTWNFGITTYGGDLGIFMDSMRVMLKGDGKATDPVTLQIYSGLGGTGTLLATATISGATMSSNTQFTAYDLQFVLASTGQVGQLNLAAGGYSVKMSTNDPRATNYLFKQGTTDVVDANGNPLPSSMIWIADNNNTGTAGTYFSASASAPILADPRFSSRTLAFGNYRVGSTVTQNTTLSNAGFFSTDGTNNADGSPKLTTQSLKITSVTPTGGTVTFGTYTSQTYSGGTVTTTTNNGPFAIASNVLDAPLTATAANTSTNITVGMNTASAGPQTGNAVFNFQSVQGKSIATSSTTLNSQTVNFSGTGYRSAVASVGSTSVNLGNFRVGTVPTSSTVAISNTAVSSDAYSEKLATASSTLGGLATVGSLPGLIAAGGSANLTVGLSSIASAGTNSGTVVLGFNTDGTGTSGLSAASIGNSPTINVTATGYRTAAPVFSSTTINLGNVREGASALTGSITLSNSVASDGYSEKLTIVDAAATNGATADSIPAGLIAAGGNAIVTLGLNNFTTAGAKVGKVAIGLASVGTGTSGLSNLTLASQDINVTANVYRAAAYSAPDVDLGKFHIGATNIAGLITITNTASSADAYSEKLGAAKNSVSGLTAGSAPALIAAGGNGTLSVNLNSVSAVGTNTGSVVFGMTSDGTGTSGLSALSLGTKTVNVTATGYSGQATWNLGTGGVWNSFASWDTAGGKPGVDGALSVDDQATFGAGPSGATSILLNGSSPVLTALTFNNSGAAYTIGSGSGGSITLGTAAHTAVVTNTAGSHTVSANVSLARNTAFSVASGTVLTMSGALNGTGQLTKSGTGTLTVSGTGNLSGDTTVTAGRLRVDGAIAASRVTVQSGATITGSGTIGATTIQSGGTLAPGNLPGNLTVNGNMTLQGGGNYNWDAYNATGTAGTGWDLTTISGVLDLTGVTAMNKFNINLNTLSSLSGSGTPGNALNFNSATSYSWTIATAAGGITGFSSDKFLLNLGAANGQYGFSNNIANQYGSGSFSVVVSGNDLNILFTPNAGSGFETPVPEPSTYAFGIAALSLAAAAIARKRKRDKAKAALQQAF